MEDWVIIISAIGGIEGIKWGINSIVNHRANAKLARASAEKATAEGDAVHLENDHKHISFLEQRITERDAKIDALYAELRKEQEKTLALTHKNQEQALKLKGFEYTNCDVRKCDTRNPPSGY